ncbi:uncharacterized mitochondrial protein-like protein [Tanacetum coccineum]
MDDLYNNLKVYEPEVKGMSTSSSSTHNMAFVSSLNNNTNITNEAVNTAHGVSTASTQFNAANFTNIDNLSDVVICSFFASQPNSPQPAHEDLQQIHPDDIEEMDLRWQMAMGKKFNTASPKAVVNAVKGNNFNVVKASACWMKGILRQFSVASTPQQNEVAKRRNMTLIEAARTMLADSKLPTTFLGRTTADPSYSQDPKSSHNDGSKPSSDDGKKVDEDLRKDSECKDQKKEDNVNNTNNVSTISNVNTVKNPKSTVMDTVKLARACINLVQNITVGRIGFQEENLDKTLFQQKAQRFTEVKTASTPMETQKPLLKDEDGEEVDVHMYRSMIGSLMYLTSSRPDIMFAVCAYARYQVNPKVSHLHAVKRIFSDYAGASLDRKSTTGGKAKKSVKLMMEKLFRMELELMLVTQS